MTEWNTISALVGGEKKGEILLRIEERDGMVVGYVSGRCEEGFDPDEAILSRPTLPAGKIEYMGIHNHSPYWCRPVFGTDLSALPEKIQSLLLRNENTYQYWLPLCGDTYKTVIRGASEGFELVTYANCEGLTVCEEYPIFVMGKGDDPHGLMKRAARLGASLLGNPLPTREERKMPEVLEYLGWCSWDAFQIRVSHKGLLEKAKEFQDKEVPVRFAIIDDMWGDAPDLKNIPADADFRTMVKGMHASPLRSFEGDPERFPQGMAAAVADLKKAGIPHVGIWFPTTGYWHGWTSDGEAKEMEELLAPAYEDRLVASPDPKCAAAYFDRLCGKVKEWGADFVKIDNQGFLAKHYRNIAPIGQVAKSMQEGIDQGVFAHFDGALINCMGMPSECMFHRPMSAVSRCSDDFMPESPAWFSKNILQCSYNGLLQGQFYVNDWDMWWTDDGQARKNSLCRAISGGPIYVSDKLGRTRSELLKPLCFADGRLLRCSESARPTADCLVIDPTASGRIFKIFNRIGSAFAMAVFNIDGENRAVRGTVSPADVGLSEDCVVYEYFSKAAITIRKDESLDVTLRDQEEFRLYLLIPKRGNLIPLGRTDKMMSPAAILSFDGETLSLYEGGEISFCSDSPVRVFAGDRELPVERKDALCRVWCHPDEKFLRFA